MKRLLDLGPCTCHWPVAEDEDGHFFCASYTNKGPYCTDHSAIAYVPPRGYVERYRTRRDGRIKGVKEGANEALYAPVDKLISGSSGTRKFEAPLRMFESA